MSISDYTLVDVTFHQSQPTNPVDGDCYFDIKSERVMSYKSGTWYEIMDRNAADRLRIIEERLEDRDRRLSEILEKDA
jgi:hypothetical protein